MTSLEGIKTKKRTQMHIEKKIKIHPTISIHSGKNLHMLREQALTSMPARDPAFKDAYLKNLADLSLQSAPMLLSWR